MARTAKLKTLTDQTVKAYVKTGDPSTALHDGGGLYLRKRDAGAYWYLRLTQPATGAQQWHRMFPDDRRQATRTKPWPTRARKPTDSGASAPRATTRAHCGNSALPTKTRARAMRPSKNDGA
jgi:hypothetical protein